MNHFRIIRLALGAGALALATASAASAQEGVAIKSILGEIGIIPKDPPQINYRERAPLVLPPRTDLPNPVDPSSLEARAGNWPKDPDVQAARREAIQARTPAMQTEAYRNSEAKRLSIEEIRAGRRRRQPPGRGECGCERPPLGQDAHGSGRAEVLHEEG